jgi:hypothetical protein
MSLSTVLDRLVTSGEYPGGNNVVVRWGEIIRASSELATHERRVAERGSIIALSSVGSIRGGIVTRANAYFLVRELPFDQVPARMRVTRRDLKRIAVIADGLEHVTKIEREFLKPVIKGPESLESAFNIKRSDLRLFYVKDGKEVLKTRHANGALTYLRRGETVPFKTSDDDLKGGIPAQRSQIRNRQPYWYSLQGEQTAGIRIVFPEHIDQRYVFTLVPAEDESMVIDKLFLFEPNDDTTAALIHASLNTLFTWYQVELRGRSQLGEGVLELKIPDFAGFWVLNPNIIAEDDRDAFLLAFRALSSPGKGPSLLELGTATRHRFDTMYLRLCGFADPEAMSVRIEHALRALAGERNERRLSVIDAKVSRRNISNVAASIDAYATRLASSIEPHPDPRSFIPEGTQTEAVPILGEIDGLLQIGTELFNQGEVLAGGTCIARASSILAAHFVKGVLLIQPELQQVDVPSAETLATVVDEWTRSGRDWHKRFQRMVEKALVGVDDARTRNAIISRSLILLHAS